MLGKLLKFDLKSMGRVFVPLWLALLAVSAVNRLAMGAMGAEGGGLVVDLGVMGEGLAQMLLMLLYVALIVAVMVVAVALVILRFYNGLLKDEGYLMFTLPVRPWQLVASKCLSAAVVAIVSLMAAVLSIVILVMDQEMTALFFSELGSVLAEMPVLPVVLLALVAVTSVIASITHVYAALALGHLAPSHRIVWSAAAYIGINMAQTSLWSVLSQVDWEEMGVRLEPAFAFTNHTGMSLVLGIMLALNLLRVAVFFVITERILSNRLNLE